MEMGRWMDRVHLHKTVGINLHSSVLIKQMTFCWVIFALLNIGDIADNCTRWTTLTVNIN